MSAKRVTSVDIQNRKSDGARITALTAYDATFARLFDAQKIDVILVGDSLGMVIQGHDTTLPVTLEDVIYHTRAVVRGSAHAHVVADMPFMSYQVSEEEAVMAAGRLVKEGGAHAVKLEGGAEMAGPIRKILSAGIPVMGHLGLTPQSVHKFGGHKIQATDPHAARLLMRDAKLLESLGCYSIVLEGIPDAVATQVTSSISIPTIGIGAGNGCDGQILVGYDMLGMNPEFKPRFVKHFELLGPRITEATRRYIEEVHSGAFPDADHSYRGTTAGIAGKPQPAAAPPRTGATIAPASQGALSPIRVPVRTPHKR